MPSLPVTGGIMSGELEQDENNISAAIKNTAVVVDFRFMLENVE